MLADRSRRDAGVVGNRRVVEELPVGQRRNVEESGKALDGPHESLGADLLAQIDTHVGLEVFLRQRRVEHRRHPADVESSLEVPGPYLRPDERMQVRRPRTTGEKVRLSPTQPTRAATREDESEGSVAIDHGLGLVEQRGQLLDLVDDDQRFARADFLTPNCAPRSNGAGGDTRRGW